MPDSEHFDAENNRCWEKDNVYDFSNKSQISYWENILLLSYHNVYQSAMKELSSICGKRSKTKN